VVELVCHVDITLRIFLAIVRVSHQSASYSLLQNVSEAELTLDAIDQMRFPNIVFHTETGSTNSLENVTESLKNPEFACCKSILMIFKTHDVGRGYLTLRKFFPTAKILLQSFDVIYSGQDKAITKDNWHTFDFGRSRVWGEFLRIKKYGERGDIAYDEVRGLVTDIEQEVESLQ